MNKKICKEMGEFMGKETGKEMELEKKDKTNDLKGARQFLAEEDGMGTVEIILIIVVLVGLVIVFKDQITQIVDDLFKKITKQANKV